MHDLIDISFNSMYLLILQGISSLCTLLPSKNRKQTPTYMQKRNLAVHEYIALDILKEAGITVPRGGVARTPDEALKIAQSLGEYHNIINSALCG